MTRKNNRRTRRIKTQELVARLILLVGTVVLMVMGTVKLSGLNVKIISSQFKMYSYYVRIDSAEKERDYNNALAANYNGPYYKIAEEADNEVKRLSEERKAYVKSVTDPVVKWSVHNGFDLLTCLLVLVSFVIAGSAWFLFFYNHNYHYVIEFEAKLFAFMFYWACYFGSVVFYILHVLCCKAIGRKCRKCRRKSDCKRSDDGKIISINRRRIG